MLRAVCYVLCAVWFAIHTQVVHYDLRCGAGAAEQATAAGSQQPGRTGARRKLVVCRGYSRTRGHTRDVGVVVLV